MTTILKKTALIFSLVWCGSVVFSQAEDTIALPDVTTVVSGGALTAGKDAVPDYSPIVPDTETARVDLPQVDDEPSPIPALEVEPKETADTKFRLGGGIATLFPLGDDTMRCKIGLVGTGELPFLRTSSNKEWGIAAHVLLGGVVGKADYDGGFDGELSAGVYLRIPLYEGIFLQPSVEFGFSLAQADDTLYFDPQFLFACSVRFVPSQIAGGALDFALTPLFQVLPISDNAVCAGGIRLGVVYSFR